MKRLSKLLAAIFLLSALFSFPAQAAEESKLMPEFTGCSINSHDDCIYMDYQICNLNDIPYKTHSCVYNESTDTLVAKADQTVYITKTGKKYHKSSCRTIKKDKKTAITLSNAKKKGYTACKVCKP